MRKPLRVLAIGLLALLLLTACDDNTPTTTTPPTTQTPHTCDWGDWMMDGEYHWKGCSICGEKYRYARHDLDEKNKCADCKVKVTVDDQQHTLLTLQETYRRYPDWERAYDAEGRLYYEATYTLDYQTNLFTIEVHRYHADGSWEYALCDSNGYPTKRILYDSKDNVKDTYTYENKYWSDGLPSRIRCSRNDVLLYEERYTHVSFNKKPDYIYLSTRTDYSPDGSHTVAKYDDDGKLTEYKCYNTDGSEVNNIGRFDAALAAPLVGSWAVMVQSDSDSLGLNWYGDMDNRPIQVLVTYTFRADGTMLITQDLDPAQHYQYRYDVEMRNWAEYTFGEYATMEEKEAACQARFGVGLHDWVTHRLLDFRFEMEGHKEQEAVYFVDKEDGLLYIADSWATFPRSGAFAIAQNTLSIHFTEEALSLSLTCLTPPMPDYSDRFSPEACSPLYGTWTGSVTLDGAMLGLGNAERSITAAVTVTFDEHGNMTMTIAMDPTEYRNFAIQVSMDLLLQQFSHLTRQQLEDLYKRNYNMTMEEFTALQVDRKDPEANASQQWTGVYFVENGQLYSADAQNPEAEGSSYTLEGDKLTMTDPETGLTLELAKLEDEEA